MFDIKKFIKSFYYAFSGIKELFLTENNFRIEVIILLFVLGLIIFFPLTITEKIALIILTGLVLVFEIFNTAIEKILDIHKVYHPEFDLNIKFIKDIMASAVLIGGLVLIGVIGVILYNYL